MLLKKLYINGELTDSGSTISVINPATEGIVAMIAQASKSDALKALNSAAAAFPTWSATPANDRAVWMDRLRDEVVKNEEHLRNCIHLEMGKPWAATQDDYQMLVDSLEYYARLIIEMEPEALPDNEGTHVHTLYREPVGVVGAFLAWNFPLLNLAYKIGPAMAAGCPIIIKPSSLTPISAYAVGELCAKIGLPAGVVNILAGDNKEVGDTISASTIPAMLTLIGSTPVGMHIMRTGATSIKRYSMELGGNAPALVFPDAELDIAADTICGLKFGNSGQICVTPNRVMVHEDVVESLTAKILSRTKAVKLGFDKAKDINMGPVMDKRSWARIDGMVQDAVKDGAQLLAGGGRPEHLNKGHYYAPTVLGNVTSDMRVSQEEIFGPVIGIQTFKNKTEALTKANDTDAGLTAYIFTQDEKLAEELARKLRFGEVQINGVKYAIHLPHCGVKQSGIGADCSPIALEEYLAPKRVSRALGH